MSFSQDNAFYMDLAVSKAEEALRMNEVPVGCVVVRDGKILAEAHNLSNSLSDPLAHAERLCIKHLQQNNQDLSDLTFYVTIEPCVMCNGILERIGATVFFGYENEIFGNKKLTGASAGTCMNNEKCIKVLKRFYQNENANTAHLRKD